MFLRVLFYENGKNSGMILYQKGGFVKGVRQMISKE